MNRSTLHWRRLLVPGIMFFVLARTLSEPKISVEEFIANANFASTSGTGAIAIALGALYSLFDVRRRLAGSTFSDIELNIERRLLRSASQLALSSEEIALFVRSRALRNVFFALIDNNESLKSRQEGVRFNGVLTTSSADLGVVSLLGWAAHACLALWRGSSQHMLMGTVFFMLWVIAESVLVPACLDRHERLSNDQLDFIDAS